MYLVYEASARTRETFGALYTRPTHLHAINKRWVTPWLSNGNLSIIYIYIWVWVCVCVCSVWHTYNCTSLLIKRMNGVTDGKCNIVLKRIVNQFMYKKLFLWVLCRNFYWSLICHFVTVLLTKLRSTATNEMLKHLDWLQALHFNYGLLSPIVAAPKHNGWPREVYAQFTYWWIG